MLFCEDMLLHACFLVVFVVFCKQIVGTSCEAFDPTIRCSQQYRSFDLIVLDDLFYKFNWLL